MTENEKQLKETEVVLMRLYQKGEITIEAFTILNDRNKQAINYTRCCTELNSKEEQAFQEWVTAQGYAKRMHGYCLKGTDNVHITDLRKYYRTLKNL